MDATTICDVLPEAGIAGVAERDAVPGAAAAFPSVWVPEPDAERARMLRLARGISRD